MTIKFNWLLTLVCSFCCGVNLNGEKIFLKDSSGASRLSNNWAIKPYNSSSVCIGAWGIKEVNKLLTYFSCILAGVTNVQQYCVMSNVYNLADANIVFINVTISTRTCQSLKEKEPKCYNNFTLSVSIKGNKLRVDEAFNLPGISVPTEYKEDFFFSNDLIVSNATGKSEIELNFLTHNYCGEILDVSLFYYACPNATNELVIFPYTAAPSKIDSPITIWGSCSENAIPYGITTPFMKCYYNGSFSVSGACQCKEGYEQAELICKACGDGYFKLEIGNFPCQKCGTNSCKSDTLCKCCEGFYRIKGKETDFATECYRPPPAPQNVTVYNVTEQSATLTWLFPKYDLLFDGYFYIECDICAVQNSFYKNTTQLQIFLDGLGSFTEYTLTISYQNNITHLTGKYNSIYFTFKTKAGAPGAVREVTTNINNDASITISWKAPFWKGDENLKYKVKYNGIEMIVSETNFNIKSGFLDKSYTVEIMGIVINSDGTQLTGPVQKTVVLVKGGIKLAALVGIAGGAIGIIVIVLILAVIVWRIKHPLYLQAVRMEDGTVKIPGGHFLNRGKLYIDPSTYSDVDDAVQELANELESKNLKIGSLLGGGEFADVYQGTLFKNTKTIDVAIKMLKHGASKNDRNDFLGEAAILGQFTDQNVILLHGVIFKEKPNLIVLEFMANGSLDKFLQENDMQFTMLQLLGMARGVASGMKCLSEMGFIHRDLAARNILVDEAFCCKVADFGMSRKLIIDDTYDTKGGKIPVRWTAPESIQFKKFTSASDIWSYGVLLWEIMSYGERPYWDWGNYEVVERVSSGYRLPPSMGCPKVVHNLMLECWNKDRTKRPKFSNAVVLLESWIRNPELLTEMAASVVTKSDEKLDYTVLQTINKWLEAIGMSKYSGNFIENGFATPRQILNFSFEDLLQLGIEPIGHRKKIYKAIQNTKIQIEAVKSNKNAIIAG